MRLNRTGIFASLIVAGLALSLASCAGGGSTAPNTSGKANIRFINGSPDAGNIDVLVNGKVVASNIAYTQITAYTSLTVGTNPLPQVAFVKTGTTTNIFPSNGTTPQTFQLGAAVNSKLTVVLEGRASLVGSLGLQVGAFVEPTLTTPSSEYSVVFHHASPAAAAASPYGVYVGYVELGSAPLYLAYGSMTFGTTNGTTASFVGVTNQPAYIGPPGVGFWSGPVIVATATPIPVTSSTATPTPSPTPTATPIPSPTVYAVTVPGPPIAIPSPVGDSFPVTGVDTSNVNQSMPDGSNNILYLYLIDSTSSPTGVQMIGTFTN
ncbi:MAG TPA: DUF4397 domain-containing protein [Candidatus Acidoferrales bacterium]|nr:DUF4397 domain-containing protein [Candidatus Acidoferrales bacterium]